MNRFGLKTLVDKLRPGRIDGLIGLLVSSLALAGVCGISLWADERALFRSPLSGLFAIAVGATFGVLATTNLWLLFGNATLMRRCIGTLLIGCVPCLGWALGFTYGFEHALGTTNAIYRYSWGKEAIFALILFRVASTCAFAFASMCLRPVSRWRIVHPDIDVTKRSKFQTSIGEIMLLTAMVAVAVESLRIIGIFDGTKDLRVVGWIAMAMAVEIVSLLVFVLLPLAVDLRGKALRRLPSLLPIWTAMFGAFSAIVFFSLRSQSPDAEARSMSIFLANFGFGVYALLGWRMAEIVGLRWSRGGTVDGQNAARTIRPAWNPIFAGVVLVAITGAVQFIHRHNLIALMHGERIAVARQLATVSRFMGSSPHRAGEYPLTYSWKTRAMTISVTHVVSRFEFRATEELPADLVAAALPVDEPSLRVAIATSDVNDDILRVLANRRLYTIDFHCEQIDPIAFERFCRSTNVQIVSLRCDTLSPDHVRSLHHMVALREVRFPPARSVHPIVFSDEMRDALRGLPLGSEVALQLPTGGVDLSSLSGLSRLVLVRTKLTSEVADELARKDLFVGDPHYRCNLVLIDCPVNSSTGHNLRKIRVPWITWTLSAKEGGSSRTDLLDLASIPNLIGLTVTNLGSGELFETHFRIRRGNGLPGCHISAFGNQIEQDGFGSDYPEQARDLLDHSLSRHHDDLNLALDELANSIVRNDAGEIEELDLQWIKMTDSGVSKLRRLGNLRQLRIGHEGVQTPSLFKSIANLDQLRVLEIPTPWVTDADLERIGKLPHLTRLQLPVHYEGTLLPHPEAIPLPNFDQLNNPYDSWLWWCSPDLKRLLSMHGLRFTEPDTNEHPEAEYSDTSSISTLSSLPANLRLTDAGIAHLLSLQHLEYLFMPGFLLSPESMSTIESLPKLRELHALFSLVSPALLKRICALDLESLSIGVADVDSVTAGMLGKTRLKTLQIFVFNTAYVMSPQQQERVTKLLRMAMPHCDVHLQFLRSVR